MVDLTENSPVETTMGLRRIGVLEKIEETKLGPGLFVVSAMVRFLDSPDRLTPCALNILRPIRDAVDLVAVNALLDR